MRREGFSIPIFGGGAPCNFTRGILSGMGSTANDRFFGVWPNLTHAHHLWSSCGHTLPLLLLLLLILLVILLLLLLLLVILLIILQLLGMAHSCHNLWSSCCLTLPLTLCCVLCCRYVFFCTLLCFDAFIVYVVC